MQKIDDLRKRINEIQSFYNEKSNDMAIQFKEVDKLLNEIEQTQSNVFVSKIKNKRDKDYLTAKITLYLSFLDNMKEGLSS